MTYSRRRKYGQHFLKSTTIARKIVEYARVAGKDVLEIGAGKGKLTKFLAASARKIFAVEFDKPLADILKKKCLPGVTVLNADFLKLDIEQLPCSLIIGNIPYSATRPILKKLIKQRRGFSRAVLMVQKEYGQKMLASVGSPYCTYVTMLMRYYFNVEKGFSVSARAFSPRPKVNSVVLALENRKPEFNVDDEKEFFDFVKGVFRYRRKCLRNCLRKHLGVCPEGLPDEILKKRPARISLFEYYYIFKHI